ncbi:MAG TPA: hypothetical protein VIT23_05550, partial [Terrimicrobiaceae bacterium]
MNFARRVWRESLWQFGCNSMFLLFAVNAKIRMICYHDLPKHRGFILASNHVSHFDPTIITPRFPRRIDWIAMSDFFDGRVTGR